MEKTLNRQSVTNLLKGLLSEVKGIDEQDLTTAEKNMRDRINVALNNIKEYE
mgnify:CR=1 FL=1